MSFLKNIVDSFLPLSDEQEVTLNVAYYVGTEEEVYKTGIPLKTDGYVHLFGNLSCAVTKRDILESHGIKSSIWKVDISECGKAIIDKKEEETLVPIVHGTHDEYCHGFLVSKPISACKIISNVNYC